jgi:hypothetical protein
VQISASHNKTDLKAFLQNIKEVGEELAII